ncbi:MAG: oligosaccharide flippase family protein [Bacteroidales bacterium]
MQNKKQQFTYDLIWYLIGTGLPMMVLFIRSPIYTRIFSPEQYGLYSLIYISFTYISAISYQSITNNAWRYYFKYKNSGKISLYKTTIFALYFFVLLVLAISCSIWYYFTQDENAKKLIVWGFIFALTNEIYNTFYVPIRLEGRAKFFNLLNTFRALFSFLILLALTFVFNYSIEAFFISQICGNILFLLPVIFENLQNKIDYNFTGILKHILRFIKYGSANLLYNIGLFLLISSDRFIIAIVSNNEKVGIYNQTYNIGQITIAALFATFNSVINPILLKKLTKNPNGSDELLISLVAISFAIFFPIVILFSIFSKDIAFLLLGEKFREAWNILPYIFLSSFFFGIGFYSEVKLKFKNKLKTLMVVSLIAASINIILNIVFIPIYGYKIAAMTTLFSYLILTILLFQKAKIKIFKFIGSNLFIKSIAYLFLLLIIDFCLNHYINFKSFPIKITLRIVFFIFVYIILIGKNYFNLFKRILQ